MNYLPIFLDVKNKPCLVVGGGEIARRKVSFLRNAGAQVHVVAPRLCRDLTKQHADGLFTYSATQFVESDVDGRAVVIAATNDLDTNRAVSEICHAKNIAVNVVDQPQLCSFIVPSIIDRSPLVVAVSSGGKAPVLARLLRSKIESMIPAAYAQLADLVGSFRGQVKTKIDIADARQHFWNDVLTGPIAELVLSGQVETARTRLQSALDSSAVSQQMGMVSLVGAGPGAPDLLTFRASQLLQQADVVVYDRLVSPAILELSRRDAEQIYVGKKRNEHTVAQEDINKMLVRLAKQGKRVVRLKGGDPFIFGRGGEEIAELSEHGIPFQVVPGITAASGCASYAGIPLTHRDYAQQCLFVTGHLRNNEVNLNWTLLAKLDTTTIVIYMGLVGLESICRQLMKHGRPAETKIALIEQGTTSQQRTFTGTLDTLPQIIAAVDVSAPTLIIVGGVVALRDSLAWFQERGIVR